MPAPPHADRFTWHEFTIVKPKPKTLSYREKLALLLGDVEGHPFRGNQWTDGEGGGSDRTESPRFKAWFKESKVVDDSGEPLVVYHGTTHDIEAFKKAGDEGLNPESDWGAGVYFTSEPEDAGENYAGEGPDLTARIENEVDRLQGENEDLSREEALAQARKALAGKSVAIYPAYVSMQKPFIVGQTNGTSPQAETWLTSEPVYDDPEDPDSDIIDEQGTLPDFMKALRDEASRHDGGDKAVDEFQTRVMDSHGSEIKASDLVKAWNDTEETSYITDDEGRLTGKEVFRAALERAGFDGVIDREVDTKFGSQRRLGQSMKGMNPDTTHFVVFTPTQIKSATGNTTFDPANPKITMSAHGRRFVLLGGAGSGNFGHAGRPGEVGGSGEGEEFPTRASGKNAAQVRDAMLNHARESAGLKRSAAAWLDPETTSSLPVRGAVKNAIVTKITAALADHPAFASMEPRPPMNLDPVSEWVKSKVNLWADTSGDSDVDAAKMQLAVARELGLTNAETDHLQRNIKAAHGGPVTLKGKEEEQLRAFVRAEYDATQAWFKEQGITHVSVFRGVSDDDDELGYGFETVTMQPASSWSTDLQTAWEFSQNGSKPKVLTARVPVAKVLSTCVTGRGCLAEQEVILLGTPTKVRVYGADDEWSKIEKKVAKDVGLPAPVDTTGIAPGMSWDDVKKSFE